MTVNDFLIHYAPSQRIARHDEAFGRETYRERPGYKPADHFIRCRANEPAEWLRDQPEFKAENERRIVWALREGQIDIFVL